jgi:hypothetical protein
MNTGFVSEIGKGFVEIGQGFSVGAVQIDYDRFRDHEAGILMLICTRTVAISLISLCGQLSSSPC